MRTNHEISASQQPIVNWFDLNGSTTKNSMPFLLKTPPRAYIYIHTLMPQCEVYSSVWDHIQNHLLQMLQGICTLTSELFFLFLFIYFLQKVLTVVLFCSVVSRYMGGVATTSRSVTVH